MNSSRKNLLDLNDDCLMEIFRYLNIADTFRIMSLHTRLEEVGYGRVAELKHLDINYSRPLDYTTSQLEVIGRNLRSLYINVEYRIPSYLALQYLKPLCSQASKLDTLRINYVHFDKEYQRCLENVAPNIQHLSLNYCQLTDDFLGPILEKCKNLRSLSLLGNCALNCKSLRYLKSKNMEELHVQHLYNASCKDEIQSYCAENRHVNVVINTENHFNFQIYDI